VSERGGNNNVQSHMKGRLYASTVAAELGEKSQKETRQEKKTGMEKGEVRKSKAREGGGINTRTRGQNGRGENARKGSRRTKFANDRLRLKPVVKKKEPVLLRRVAYYQRDKNLQARKYAEY